MKIDPSERWLLLGKTGSGKTELAKHFLRQVSNVYPVVIVDPNELWLGRGKGGRKGEWASRREVGSIDKPHLVQQFNAKWKVQCLQPDEDELEKLDRLCFEAMKKGDIFIYFDETEGIAAATHVPKGIPRIFKSQAEHFVVMKVGQEDASVAAEIAHVAEKDVSTLKPYEWIYYNHNMDVGELHSPIPLKET